MKAAVAGLLFACVLAAGCTKRVETEPLSAPPDEAYAPPLAELAGGPDGSFSADQAAADANAWRRAEPYAPPPGLIVTYRFLPDGTRVTVISNRPIPNPKERHVFYRWSETSAAPRHHARLAGGSPVTPPVTRGTAAEAPSRAAAPSPTPAPEVAPAPETQAAPKAGDATSAAPATSATVAPESAAKSSVTVDKLKGFVISPALWIVAGLALLIILILAMMGGRKPKRRTAPRVGGEAHA